MLIYLIIILTSALNCLTNLPKRTMSKENKPAVTSHVLTCKLIKHGNDQLQIPSKHETILTRNMTNVIMSINSGLPGAFDFFSDGMTMSIVLLFYVSL